MFQAFQYFRKLKVVNSTVAEKDAIDKSVVEVLASLCDTSTMTFAKSVLLQH